MRETLRCQQSSRQHYHSHPRPVRIIIATELAIVLHRGQVLTSALLTLVASGRALAALWASRSASGAATLGANANRISRDVAVIGTGGVERPEDHGPGLRDDGLVQPLHSKITREVQKASRVRSDLGCTLCNQRECKSGSRRTNLRRNHTVGTSATGWRLYTLTVLFLMLPRIRTASRTVARMNCLRNAASVVMFGGM